MSTNATLPVPGKAGSRLDAQGGDQGRGVSTTSQQVGWGNELGDVLAREKVAWADICAEFELVRGLSLGVRLQIDHADGVGAGLAGLQFGSVGRGLLHGVAMRHHVSRAIRDLALHTLRPAYRGRCLGNEQHQQ